MMFLVPFGRKSEAEENSSTSLCNFFDHIWQELGLVDISLILHKSGEIGSNGKFCIVKRR